MLPSRRQSSPPCMVSPAILRLKAKKVKWLPPLFGAVFRSSRAYAEGGICARRDGLAAEGADASASHGMVGAVAKLGLDGFGGAGGRTAVRVGAHSRCRACGSPSTVPPALRGCGGPVPGPGSCSPPTRRGPPTTVCISGNDASSPQIPAADGWWSTPCAGPTGPPDTAGPTASGRGASRGRERRADHSEGRRAPAGSGGTKAASRRRWSGWASRGPGSKYVDQANFVHVLP